MFFEVTKDDDGDLRVTLYDKGGHYVSLAIVTGATWFFRKTRIKAAKRRAIEYYFDHLPKEKVILEEFGGPAVDLIKHPYKGNEDE